MSSGKKGILTLCSILIILLFFSIDVYKAWFRDKVWEAIDNIPEQLVYMEPKERYGIKLGETYLISLSIADYLRKQYKTDTGVVLLPPKDLMKAHGIAFLVPEPVVFYYYTGIKAVWANSSNVSQANYALISAYKKDMRLVPVNARELDSLVNAYRKYNISL